MQILTLELISLIPLVGSPDTDPLAVKLLDNRLFIPASHLHLFSKKQRPIEKYCYFLRTSKKQNSFRKMSLTEKVEMIKFLFRHLEDIQKWLWKYSDILFTC